MVYICSDKAAGPEWRRFPTFASAAADSAIGHRLEIASRWLCTPVCRRAVLSGIHLSDCFYAPASGYRHRTSGALTSVGVNSQSWSSAPAAAGSANASYLVFDATLMYPEYSNSRSYAFPVRCVQYLQLLFQRITYICSDKAASARSSENQGFR